MYLYGKAKEVHAKEAALGSSNEELRVEHTNDSKTNGEASLVLDVEIIAAGINPALELDTNSSNSGTC